METKISCSAANEIILTCEKIAQSFLENIFELSTIREEWDMKYARDLVLRINSVKINYLHSTVNSNYADNQKTIQDALITSLKDISLLHALIKVDFKDDITFQNHILEVLGYTEFYSEARNGDLYSLYKLLEAFSKNLTKELIDVISSRTINYKLPYKILSYFDSLKKFEFCLKLEKQSKQISREGCTEINNLYSIIKDICRTTTAYYTFDPIRRDQFSFFTVMLNLERPVVRMN